MDNLNSILIEGNLCKDPLTVDYSGGKMCKFVIGVNRYFLNKNKEFIQESSFFNIITWGSTANVCSKYLKKGRGVRVLGRLKQERWQTEGNEIRERIVIVAEHVEFQPERKEDKNDPEHASNIEQMAPPSATAKVEEQAVIETEIADVRNMEVAEAMAEGTIDAAPF